MMAGMTPARAHAAVDDLLALAHAVKSGTLEKDTKAFLGAAKKASEAEANLSATKNEMKRREDAADRKEKSNSRAFDKIKSDREVLKADREQWAADKSAQEQDLQRQRTRLANDAAAVKARDDKATATMNEARSMMDAARELDRIAKAMKADYEGRLAKIKEAAGA